MMKFFKLDDKLKQNQDSLEEAKSLCDKVKQSGSNNENELKDLQNRLNSIKKVLGIEPIPQNFYEDNIRSIEAIDSICYEFIPDEGSKKILDNSYNLKGIDILFATLIGGLGVIIDFLTVKIPKDQLYQGKIEQSGSGLTKFFKSFGLDEKGNASKWVNVLEEKFKVPYDKSIDPSIPGLHPRTHRMLTPGHDPILGIIFGTSDIINGNMTSIDANGVIRIEKIAENIPFEERLLAPIIWFCHILSDVATKMGIPIPGWCVLNTFQCGSFGEKQRTIAEIARYMYLESYDLRHLLTMSVVPATIGLLIRLYFFLFAKGNENANNILCEQEYAKIKNNIKLHKLLFIAHSVAAVGNAAKIATYQGNPTSINLPVWLATAKEAVIMARVVLRDKSGEQAIEGRHQIDDCWEYLLKANNSTL